MATERKQKSRLAVRRFILDTISRHPGESVMIPSYTELSKRFELARSNVQLELKDLMENGFLYSKKGIGTFTCPGVDGSSNLRIGVIKGDGKFVFDSYYSLALQGYLNMELAKLPAAIQDVRLFSQTEDELLEELRGLRCDAFLWMVSRTGQENLCRKLAALKPVLTVGRFVKGVSGIVNDLAYAAETVSTHLWNAGIRKILFSHHETFRKQAFPVFRRVYREGGEPFQFQFFTTPGEAVLCLDRGWRPDAVFFKFEDFQLLYDAALRNKIDLNRCRFVSPMYKPLNYSYPFILAELPFDEFAVQIREFFSDFLTHPDSRPEHRLVSLNYRIQTLSFGE